MYLTAYWAFFSIVFSNFLVVKCGTFALFQSVLVIYYYFNRTNINDSELSCGSIRGCATIKINIVVESPNAPITSSHFSKFNLIIEAKRRHRLQIHCLFILILHSRMFWKALDYITS